jgi:three-Cys-motif partner protein
MSSANNDEVISRASPHTIKKFELIETYVKTWAQKLLNNQYCNGLVFIDCMCNSGEYYDDNHQQVFGTAVRISKVLREAAGQYPNKQIYLYFNDISTDKVHHLELLIEKDKSNFHTHTSVGDGNELLKKMGQSLIRMTNVHYLLVYDPYDANIDWNAVYPFFNSWGEVIINHALMDSTRAVKMAKSDAAVSKYEGTYQMKIGDLSAYGSDRAAYESRIEDIIKALRRDKTKDYFIAAAPFFNKKNAIVYNLIHCTSNIAGFRLYKKSAWQTFGGQSSTKDTHGDENQLSFDVTGKFSVTTTTDEDCYHITDISKYLQSQFNGQEEVPLNTVWSALDRHPIFPYDCYRNEIKRELKQLYGAQVSKSGISFSTGENRI